MSKYKIPNDIENEARLYMEEVVSMLEERGVMENIDNAALTMLARNYSTFIRASKQVEKDGMMITNNKGNLEAHPMIKVAKDAQVQAMKVMVEFGLTAKSRKKLPMMEKKEEESPLEQFARKKKSKIETR
ncbi:MAG: terminase [Bacteroidetes bacterium GWE2_39_28]|nr:MAG: terminase [Bacteroidetes bacterium GWE2_39_28]OFY12822.1 MAG: terminase [Bacteroidetes bacterium GWF2_39_10]OFZ11044.1 MAG: terminase [Bacteroidetes bacterium RIFOXYC2_FULL_39_11]HCT93699.1 phage terminase small subunit P27 family [Rikenellaceae bacterium]